MKLYRIMKEQTSKVVNGLLTCNNFFQIKVVGKKGGQRTSSSLQKMICKICKTQINHDLMKTNLFSLLPCVHLLLLLLLIVV